MKPAPHEPILDACLEEILGGQSPPDLSASILEAVAQNATEPAVTPPPAPVNKSTEDRIVQAVVESPAVTDNTAKVSQAAPRGSSEPNSKWPQAATIASILTIGACIGLIALKLLPPSNPTGTEVPLANNKQSPTEVPEKENTDNRESKPTPNPSAIADGPKQTSPKPNKNQPTPPFGSETGPIQPAQVTSAGDNSSAKRIEPF